MQEKRTMVSTGYGANLYVSYGDLIAKSTLIFAIDFNFGQCLINFDQFVRFYRPNITYFLVESTRWKNLARVF